ncbi:hypothetical protein [Chitinimonas sp.]|uniref:hypothetical protein n=1 Tax=Chitinimonas sp. TaxID=1934313 RepID=UPI002F95633C
MFSRLIRSPFRLSLAILIGALSLPAAQAESVGSHIKTPSGAQAQAQVVRRMDQPVNFEALKAGGTTVALTQPSQAQLTQFREQQRHALQRSRQALPIGFARELPANAQLLDASKLTWRTQKSGKQTAQWAITSPGASRLRLGMNINPEFIGEIRFANQLGTKVSDTVLRAAWVGQPTFWSPTVEDDTVVVEFSLPEGAAIPTWVAKVQQLSHMPDKQSDNKRPPVSADIVPGTWACHTNFACNLTNAQRTTGNGVAEMEFVVLGSSYVCTGTLLNDRYSSNTPYFYTANHCIPNQTVASTLETYWFFEDASCVSNNQVPATTTRLSGGATLLNTDVSNDHSLLRLNSTPPDGVMYVGWDSTDLGLMTSVLGIHHPKGDVKKKAIGLIDSPTKTDVYDSESMVSHPALTTVRWTMGGTQSGSSGSGLFTCGTTECALRGGLFGSAIGSTCGRQQSFYSNFGIAYRAAKAWLEADNRPLTPQTGWWWNPGEGGRGYSLEKSGNNIFFAAYMYDEAGAAVWYVGTLTLTDANTYEGTLTYYAGGQTLNGSYKSPATTTGVGQAKLKFSSASNALLTFTGSGRTLSFATLIERFNIVANGLSAPKQAGQPESGWWWNSSEGGRGYFLEVQNGNVYIAGYMYSPDGKPVWYVSLAPLSNNLQTLKGSWGQYQGGQTLGGLYRQASLTNANVGAMTINFSSTTSATLTLPNGRQVALQRFQF